MPNKPGCIKYYGMSHWPAENGLDYDREIDVAIFTVLSSSSVVSSGELKRKIEGILNRRINRQTFYNHLKMLVKDSLLNKQDSGERGKQSVFYSLTDETKRRKKLHLLRTDSDYGLVKHLYAHLLFRHLAPASGTSIEDIKNQSFNYYRNRLLSAFQILLKNGLVKLKKPTGMKYIIADKAFYRLVVDICELDKITRTHGKSLLLASSRIREEIDKDILAATDHIKNKHEKTLKKFSFLSDVIQIFCPLLFPQLPYREWMPLSIRE